MSTNITTNENVYANRDFLEPDSLSSVRAYMNVTKYPNPEHAPHVEAGFGLTEEGEGHYCIYDYRDGGKDNLPRVREAAKKIIAALQGLVDAIDSYTAEHPFVPEAGEEG